MTERTEERLRAALRTEADGVDASPDAWSNVQRGVRAERRRSVVTRGAIVGAAAAVVAVVVGIGVLRDDGDTTVDVTPAATTSTSLGTTTTTVAAPTQPDIDGIWPFTSTAELRAYAADPGVGMFFDAEQTALEFAREYLGMPDPVATGAPRTVETGQVWVTVVPKPGAPMTTTVWMYEVDGIHTVYFAETPNIRVDPTSFEGVMVRDAVGVLGQSTSFEAHVDVEVRDADGRVLGRSYVMGGANGDFLPFAGEIPIDAPTTPTGAVILSTSSAEDGSLSEATVVQISFATESQFSVFFHRGDELVDVSRTGPRTQGVLRQALEALVAGPTDEEQAAGLGSLFSDDTADVLAGITVREDGTAVVDLAYEVNNASTSAGSQRFLAELNATVFQFPTVERVEYRLRGSCEAFWTWLQVGECQVVPRPAN